MKSLIIILSITAIPLFDCKEGTGPDMPGKTNAGGLLPPVVVIGSKKNTVPFRVKTGRFGYDLNMQFINYSNPNSEGC